LDKGLNFVYAERSAVESKGGQAPRTHCMHVALCTERSED
jgi:hypothetical protein